MIKPDLSFFKKAGNCIFILLLCAHAALAQDLVGKVTDRDTLRTPLFLAEITQMQDGHVIGSYKSYYDGTYRVKVKPAQTYQLKFSYPGRSDTTVTISIDKHGTLFEGTLFISLRRDGMRLAGFILDKDQEIPIKDVAVVLKNVMTRKEDKYFTGSNGYYNFKMEYETNYTLKIDKMSAGIMNKYQDTSFSISTIGFNKPLDFKLDIKLGPSNGYVAPRPEYDPRALSPNRNLKPVVEVIGLKDTTRKHEQDSIMAMLSNKLSMKDSMIASLNKQIEEIKAKNEPTLAQNNADQKAKQEQEASAAEEQEKQRIAQAEEDLKAKKQAEQEIQDKLNKEIMEAEARRLELAKLDKELAQKDNEKVKADAQKNEQKEKTDNAQAKLDEQALVKQAESIARRRLSRRRQILDSLSLIEGSKEAKASLARMDKAKKDIETANKAKFEKQQQEEEARQRELAAARARQDRENKESRVREAAQLKLVREARERAISDSIAEDARVKREQLEADLAAMKKAREEAEAKVLAEKTDKEEKDKLAQIEVKRSAKELAEAAKLKKAQEDAENKPGRMQRVNTQKNAEQKELEAKMAMEEQEKKKLAQQLHGLQKNEETPVAKGQEGNPDQAQKDDARKSTITYWENKMKEERKAKNDTSSQYVDISGGWTAGNKVIHAHGAVKNGQTEDALANVSINIRRLNSIVSQEVTTDPSGKYDMVVDSGYFYLVSFYKDKYEISKQILDLTTYTKGEYTLAVQYLKEQDDFDPAAKMPIVQFAKNSSKLPNDVWSDMESIIKLMKDVPELKIKLYGMASVDEDYPMELSVTRARLLAGLALESGIKASRIRINGLGAYRPRSGCTEGKQCTEAEYKMDRVVMYKVVKE